MEDAVICSGIVVIAVAMIVAATRRRPTATKPEIVRAPRTQQLTPVSIPIATIRQRVIDDAPALPAPRTLPVAGITTRPENGYREYIATPKEIADFRERLAREEQERAERLLASFPTVRLSPVADRSTIKCEITPEPVRIFGSVARKS